MKVKVVTSFGPGGYEKYAERFIRTFIKHWPKDFVLEVCYHDQEYNPEWPQSEAPKVVYRSLHEDVEHDPFIERFGKFSDKNNFRRDVGKFCHKVFALTGTTLEDEDWLIWLDADIETFKDVPKNVVGAWCQESDVIHLGRDSMAYSETSFLAFNLRAKRCVSLLRDLRGTYTTGEVMHYTETHDGFVFERLLNIHVAHGLDAHSLTQDRTKLNAFENSPLALYMVHYKGPGKEGDLTTPDRYMLLNDMVKLYKPKCILEVGTWKGIRAQQFATHALNHHDSFHYIGLDLFEGTNDEINAKELHTKPIAKYSEVYEQLTKLAELIKEHGKTFTFELIKGDSKDTLPKLDLSKVDMAFIDGGHSRETCEADYLNLKEVPVIIFDDFFQRDNDGNMPAPEFCGTNYVIEKHKLKPMVFMSKDPVLGGGITSLAVLVKEGLPRPMWQRPVRITPKDCVNPGEIVKNIESNVGKMDRWLKKCAPNNLHAVIVSGGPSVKDQLPKIKEMYENGARIFCVKHSHPILLEAGIKPYGCVILDPRPIEGTSTHGKVRSTLLDKIHPRTLYFVASMTHPSVTDFLKERKAKLVGWHAYSSAAKEYKLPEGSVWITGGTCAAFRSVGLAHYLGFRHVHLIGFDLCIPEPENPAELTPDGKAKYLNVAIGPDKRPFWTTGELLAASQDFESLMQKRDEADLNIYVYGDGIVPELWKELGEEPWPQLEEAFTSIGD